MGKRWGDDAYRGTTDILWGMLFGWSLVFAAYLGLVVHGWLS